MGREIAYKKIREMESMGKPIEQIYFAGAAVCAMARVGVFVVETEDSSLCLHGICSTSCLREKWRYYYAQK